MPPNPRTPDIHGELVTRSGIGFSRARPSLDTHASASIFDNPQANTRQDDSSTSPTLPMELIAMVGSYLPRSDQASCLRVSQLFFEAIAPLVWAHVRLSDIRTTRAVRSPLALDLLSKIKTLEIDGKHHPTVCNGIGDLCTTLDQIVIKNRSEQICTRATCGSLPTARPFRIVIHNTESPFHSTGRGLFIDGSVSHLSLYFSFPSPDKSWASDRVSFNVSDILAPRSLSLVFRPLTSSTMFHAFGTWSRPRPPFYIDPSRYEHPSSVPQHPQHFDVCLAIAQACVGAPKHCAIRIVNLCQMPINENLNLIRQQSGQIWELPPDTQFIIRSITGRVAVIGQARGTGTLDKKRQSEAEEKLSERMGKIQGMIKHWMQILLKNLDEEDELDDRWERISLVPLHEYKDLEAEKLKNSRSLKYW